MIAGLAVCSDNKHLLTPRGSNNVYTLHMVIPEDINASRMTYAVSFLLPHWIRDAPRFLVSLDYYPALPYSYNLTGSVPFSNPQYLLYIPYLIVASQYIKLTSITQLI